MWLLDLSAKVFAIITAFGMTSQGAKREDAIRFGVKGALTVLVISIGISVINKTLYFFTLSQEFVATLIFSYIVLRAVFFLILKR